jgi:hypothetical protein
MGPVADRASRLLGWLAGHRDDLDDLLGGEGGRPSGARGIIEDLLDQAEQLRVGEAILLGLGQVLGGGEPAVTPEPDRDPAEAEVPGGGLQAGVVGQPEHDEDATDQPLGGGVPLANLFEQGSLTVGEFDCRRRRAAHDRCHSRLRV